MNEPYLTDTDTNSYFAGASISPDGLCLLTTHPAPANAILQYDTSSTSSSSSSSSSTPILTTKLSSSFLPNSTLKWYPLMNSSSPETCLHLASTSSNPIHLIDAYTGLIKHSHTFISYPLSQSDELVSPTVAEFHPNGAELYCGFRDGNLRVVDLSRFGDKGGERIMRLRGDEKRKSKKRKKGGGGGGNFQKGILSAISFSSRGLFAVGTYSGSVHLYDERVNNNNSYNTNNSGVGKIENIGQGSLKVNKHVQIASIDDDDDDDDKDYDMFSAGRKAAFSRLISSVTKNPKGISQLKFLENGYELVSASRKDDAVVLWDIRKLGQQQQREQPATRVFMRDAGNTNQKLEFDVCENSNRLFCGCAGGEVRVWDLNLGENTGGGKGKAEGEVWCDTGGKAGAANGVSIVDGRLAVCTGERATHTDSDTDSDTDSSDSESDSKSSSRASKGGGGVFLYNL